MYDVISVLISFIGNPIYLILLFCGVLLGVFFGAMPGLTAPMGIAILVPLTYTFDPIVGIGMLLGMYCGAVFGGSLSAILINIPGTPSAMMTALDGNAMARKGEAGKALGIATIASTLGGIISALLLMAIAPVLSRLALKFGPHEYFAVGVFGLSIIAGLSGSSLYKGVIAALLGVFVTVVGLDPVTSSKRFTYGVVELMSGFSFIPMMIGLFGFREVLIQVQKGLKKHSIKHQRIKNIIPGRVLLSGIIGSILRGSAIGTFIGALPGAGGPIAAFISYDTCKKLNKPGDCEFGEGRAEGIAAAESANNAVTGGALIPLLTLGIPGDAAVAIMLGAFMMHDLSPGPLLFQNHVDVVYSIYFSLILANLAILAIGFGGGRLFVGILKVKIAILLPIVFVLCVVGSYGIHNSVFDVGVMISFGVLGFLLSKVDIPSVPLVLGIVLGPMIEQNLRQSLLIEDGNWLNLIARPWSGSIFALTLLSVVWSTIKSKKV